VTLDQQLVFTVRGHNYVCIDIPTRNAGDSKLDLHIRHVCAVLLHTLTIIVSIQTKQHLLNSHEYIQETSLDSLRLGAIISRKPSSMATTVALMLASASTTSQ
jgi:hypothetical protein